MNAKQYREQRDAVQEQLNTLRDAVSEFVSPAGQSITYREFKAKVAPLLG